MKHWKLPLAGIRTRFLGMLLFFLSFSAFVIGVYLFFAYQDYKASQKTQQRKETQHLLQKESKVIADIQDLMDLTQKRILRADNHADRIQRILSSLQHLAPTLKLPEFQKASYVKLTPPQKLFTRFGVLPFSQSMKTLNKEEIVSLQRGIFIFQMPVLNGKERLEGLFKLQITKDSLRERLGHYEEIDFSYSDSRVKGSFLKVHKHAPLSFKGFTLKHRKSYSIFLAYALLSVLLITGLFLYLKAALRKAYHSRMEQMNETTEQSETENLTLRKSLDETERELKVQTEAHQAQHTFWKQIIENEKSKSAYLYRALTFVSQSLQDSAEHEDSCEVVSSCIPLAEYPLIEIAPQGNKAKFCVNDLLVKVQDVFADKIDQQHIQFQVHDPGKCQILAHLFSMELIFLNILGKCLYRMPPRGKLSIHVESDKDKTQLLVTNNGFSVSAKQEELIERKHVFFLESLMLERLLRTNNIHYAQEENTQKLELIIPKHVFVQEGSSNVVPLFK